MVSAVLRHGPSYFTLMRDELRRWMESLEFARAIGAFVVSLVAVVPIASGQVLPSSNGGPILRCGNAMV